MHFVDTTSITDAMDELRLTTNELVAFAKALGVVIGSRTIQADDAMKLFPEEALVLTKAVDKVRRQSGAARAVARDLMLQIGMPPGPILKSPSGSPIWPQGVVGSLAHEETVAVAAVAHSKQNFSMGIDIEPNLCLPDGTAPLIATRTERQRYGVSITESRKLFVIKEAVFKATFPLDHYFLDFHDVEVDLNSLKAYTRSGRTVAFRMTSNTYVLALAVVL